MTEKPFRDEFSVLDESYRTITAQIEQAKREAGRNDDVRLLAVTKTVAVPKINHAVGLGATLLGENRVQEFLGKCDEYDPKSEIHFIGGLQKNKVKYIIDKVTMIHSVDSAGLADEINRQAERHGLSMDVLIEVNIAGEATKGGVPVCDVHSLAEHVRGLGSVKLRGLMTIPPTDFNGSSERYFAQMQELFAKYSDEYGEKFDTLSMGMSGDFRTAIKYGSTIVRLGSLLFGYRNY